MCVCAVVCLVQGADQVFSLKKINRNEKYNDNCASMRITMMRYNKLICLKITYV